MMDNSTWPAAGLDCHSRPTPAGARVARARRPVGVRQRAQCFCPQYLGTSERPARRPVVLYKRCCRAVTRASDG